MRFLGSGTRFMAVEVLCYLLPSSKQQSDALHTRMSTLLQRGTMGRFILSQNNKQRYSF